MANYDSSNTGGQIDGSVASSSLYFSGAGANAHISASGNISSSTLWVTNNISASAIYADEGYFSGSSIYLGGYKWDQDRIQRLESGRPIKSTGIARTSRTVSLNKVDADGLSFISVGSGTIRSFINVVDGQKLTLISTGNVTISHNASYIICPSEADMRLAANDVVEFIFENDIAYCVSFSDNSR